MKLVDEFTHGYHQLLGRQILHCYGAVVGTIR